MDYICRIHIVSWLAEAHGDGKLDPWLFLDLKIKPSKSQHVAFRTPVRCAVRAYVRQTDEWNFDRIPEIMDGKNVADFVDPDIDKKLAMLEEEEEQLEVSLVDLEVRRALSVKTVEVNERFNNLRRSSVSFESKDLRTFKWDFLHPRCEDVQRKHACLLVLNFTLTLSVVSLSLSWCQAEAEANREYESDVDEDERALATAIRERAAVVKKQVGTVDQMRARLRS